MAEKFGAENSIITLAIFFIALLIWRIITEYNEFKAKSFDIESEIELIDSKILRLKK